MLIGAFPCNHDPWRLKENLEVEPERPLPAVLKIKPHHFVKTAGTAAFDLPETGNSGFSELLDAQRTLLEFLLIAKQYSADAYKQLAEIERIVNSSLHISLDM